MSAIITLTTDFGSDSPYVAQMKGVLLTALAGVDVTLVDVCHAIEPQRISAGAVIMRDSCFRFPTSSIHIGVVDPGVGSERDIVACRIGGHFFVAPDNGLLSSLTESAELQQAVRVNTSLFPDASSTFHGRDIMAPVAAKIAAGASLESLGERMDSLSPLRDPPQLSVGEREIGGEVVWVDAFGNLVTNISADQLDMNSDCLEFQLGSVRIKGLESHYAAVDAGSLIALIGSNGRLEFAVVNGSAANQLRLGLGASIRAVWS